MSGPSGRRRDDRDPTRTDGGEPLASATMRVLLVDRSRLFTEALRRLLSLEDDVAAVGIASSAAEALRLLGEEPFTIAVASPELAAEFWSVDDGKERPRTVPVVVLADAREAHRARELFRLGAIGWVDRARSTADLMSALRVCLRGDVCMAPDALAQLTHDPAPTESAESARARVLSVLTHREKQVFMLLEQGMGRAEIASILQLSPNTVRTHIHRILRRLDVHSSLAALALARAGNVPMQ